MLAHSKCRSSSSLKQFKCLKTRPYILHQASSLNSNTLIYLLSRLSSNKSSEFLHHSMTISCNNIQKTLMLRNTRLTHWDKGIPFHQSRQNNHSMRHKSRSQAHSPVRQRMLCNHYNIRYATHRTYILRIHHGAMANYELSLFHYLSVRQNFKIE